MFKPTSFFSSVIFFFFYFCANLISGTPIEISREFNLFTEKNLQGYLKPLFTSFEQSLNSNLFTKAIYNNYWTISLDISVMGMFIPESQKTYNAERPDLFGATSVCETGEIRDGVVWPNYVRENIQPTLYGGKSTAIFSAPQNHKLPDSTYKTAAYPEGNNITIMSGFPALQLNFGIPTRTQFRFRFITFPISNEMTFFYSLVINQQIDKFLGIFNPRDSLGLSFHGAYHGVYRDPGINILAFAFGLHFSKTWRSGFSSFIGAQYETISGSFEFVRESGGTFVDSPYREIRESDRNIKINVESFTKFRVLGGISYRTKSVEFHGDIAWATQPILTFGITFWIADWGRPKIVEERYERYEKIERIEKIEKKEKIENK